MNTYEEQQEWRRHPKYHREKIELVRACDEERWRTHTEESVEGGYTREKEERTTENKMERRVLTRFEKNWTESGRGDRHGDVEKKDHQLYRRPYMMGKARGKEEIIQYYLILITYYSSTLFVLFDHPYCLLRFISVCFYLFVLIFYHIFHFGWLMQMPYIISVLLFITHQHFFII